MTPDTGILEPPAQLSPSQWGTVEDNLPLVYYVAQRYRHIPATAYEDLISRLTLRLCKCIAQWDPKRNLRLSSYLVTSLQGEIRNYFRDEMWVVKPPRELRENSLYALVERDGDRPSIAERCGEDPETLRSAALPISLDERFTGEDGQYTPEFISDGTEVAASVIEKVGGNQILRLVFQALNFEERVILALQAKGRSIREVEERFRISRSAAQEVWEELQDKAQQLYLLALEGEPLPQSEGNMALRQALKARFVPPKLNFVQLRQTMGSSLG